MNNEKKEPMEVRVALLEHDATQIKVEQAGQREQNKAHYTELKESIYILVTNVNRLVEGLEREGVYNVSREELEQRARDKQFVRDMRETMGDLAKRTRNTLFTLMVLGSLAISAWFVGIKHPEIFR